MARDLDLNTSLDLELEQDLHETVDHVVDSLSNKLCSILKEKIH